jgi:hypothetical protein
MSAPRVPSVTARTHLLEHHNRRVGPQCALIGPVRPARRRISPCSEPDSSQRYLYISGSESTGCTAGPLDPGQDTTGDTEALHLPLRAGRASLLGAGCQCSSERDGLFPARGPDGRCRRPQRKRPERASTLRIPRVRRGSHASPAWNVLEERAPAETRARSPRQGLRPLIWRIGGGRQRAAWSPPKCRRS